MLTDAWSFVLSIPLQSYLRASMIILLNLSKKPNLEPCSIILILFVV